MPVSGLRHFWEKQAHEEVGTENVTNSGDTELFTWVDDFTSARRLLLPMVCARQKSSVLVHERDVGERAKSRDGDSH